MLAVELRLLTGRYVATSSNDRSGVEWPPHPARLFSALVAAWADADAVDGEERLALEWLEAQGAPELTCSIGDEVAVRSTVAHFVPVNDAHGKQVLPEERVRKERSFPSVTPESPIVVFTWPDAGPEPEAARVLDGLLARVHRLGHSSSFVSCRLVDDPPAPSLVPGVSGDEAVLRVAAPGSFDVLQAKYAHHRGVEPRVLPSRSVLYRDARRVPAPPVPTTPFAWDPLLVLVVRDRDWIDVRRGLDLARAVRGALLVHGDQPPPEIVSGHVAGPVGAATPPTARSHLAVVPLPFVGHRHADGSVKAVALVLPRDATDEEGRAVGRALGAWRRAGGAITLGPAGAFEFLAAEAGDARATLRGRTWCGPGRTWASVTPVALDRHPGDLWDPRPDRRERAGATARASVVAAVSRLGLPEPREVALSPVGLLAGVPRATAFEPYLSRPGVRRFLVHVGLTFDEPVEGPLLVGAGRFYGYGLLRPTDEEGTGRG